MKKASVKETTEALLRSGVSPESFITEEDWPRTTSQGYYSGKFEAGEIVRVLPSKGRASAKRFKSWLGKSGIVIGWQRSGGYGGQSEYKIYNPETGKSRWIWADQLEEVN